jgi:hypothetical protein
MWLDPTPHRLKEIPPAQLRPTQLTVGFEEVRAKRAEWAGMGRHRRRALLREQLFPAVLGPGGHCYILDHHHFGLALQEEGVKQVWVSVFDDLSWLEPATFWRTLEFRSWAHLFDARGQRREFRHAPQGLKGLEDDPWRSLAGAVRRAGGYAKSPQPFAEFLWADHFRARLARSLLRKQPAEALARGLHLARAHEARYLPGWSGEHDG